jgi:hypothetical protein
LDAIFNARYWQPPAALSVITLQPMWQHHQHCRELRVEMVANTEVLETSQYRGQDFLKVQKTFINEFHSLAEIEKLGVRGSTCKPTHN